MKRLYSSGSQKRTDKNKKIEAAVIGTPSVNSFFKFQDSRDDTRVAAAVVENADTAEEEANVSPVFPYALKTSKEERDITCRGEADDINNNFSS